MAVIVNDSNFESEVLQSEGVVLVDFWAEWCGPCRMLAPSIEHFAETHPDVKVCKVNVDESPMTSYQYKIASIPTVVAFKNGKAVSGFVGVQPESAIETIVQKASAAE